MAALSTEGGLTQRQTAEVFGVSQSVVAQSATGKIGGKPATEDRVAKRISREENIKDTALTKLMMTLGLINQEKLEDLDAKGLAQVGSHLAKVSQSLTPQQNAGNQVQLVVYAPQMRDEGRFKVKEI
jgi:predicted transcriptional regulator